MSSDVTDRYLSELSTMVFLTLDGNGFITRANAHARETICQDLTGKRFKDITVNFYDSFDLDELLAKTGKRHLVNVVQRDAMPVTLYFRFLADGDSILAFGETDSREVEQLRSTLVEANSELSNMTRELQKANAELVRLGMLKNQFLGMAAHDLRGPLGAILGFSQFLAEEQCLDSEEREILSLIEQSSQGMLALIDDMLDYSRIEAGCLGLKREPTDFKNLLDRSITLNRILASPKTIRIECHVLEPLPSRIMIDPVKVEQVLNNILSNAVKYSPRESTVTASSFMSGDTVTVAVKDQGPGITEKEMSAIFEPFRKGSASPTGGEKSTGLGLHIARRIILAHGGKMWIESEPGKGSCFYFTIPGEDAS